MDVKIDSEMLQEVFKKAIFDVLTPEKRDELLGNAIKSLFKENRNQYDKRSELEIAFTNSIRNLAERLVGEMLLQPEHHERIESVVKEAFDKVFLSPDSRKHMVERVANAVSLAMFSRG